MEASFLIQNEKFKKKINLIIAFIEFQQVIYIITVLFNIEEE
jgi:hypothetical protein